jgi:imidazolonepropionase-like amidohydrolase
VTVARLMDLEAAGSIDVGKVADLVLLDANPLGDVRNLRRQAGVMLRGRWLSRAQIDAKLAAIAATR